MHTSKLLSSNHRWERLCLTTQDSVVLYLEFSIQEALDKQDPDEREEALAECEDIILDLLEEEPSPEITQKICTFATHPAWGAVRKKLLGPLLTLPFFSQGQGVFRQMLSDALEDEEARKLLEAAASDDTLLWATNYSWVAIIVFMRLERYNTISRRRRSGALEPSEVVYCAMAEYLREPSVELARRFLFSEEYRSSNPTRWGVSTAAPERMKETQFTGLPSLSERDHLISNTARIFGDVAPSLTPMEIVGFLLVCDPRERGKFLRTLDRKHAGRLIVLLSSQPNIDPLAILTVLEDWAYETPPQRHLLWERQEDKDLQHAKNLIQEMPISDAPFPLFTGQRHKLEITHRIAFYGCKVPWERFFTQTEAGVMTALVAQVKPRTKDGQGFREELLARWFEECANQAEWDLALPVAAAEMCSRLDRWAGRASATAFLPFAEASAASERSAAIAELLRYHQEAVFAIPLLAEYATHPKLKAKAWAITAAFGLSVPPVEDDLGFYLQILLFLEPCKERQPSIAELFIVEGLLQREEWRAALLMHPSFPQSLPVLHDFSRASQQPELMALLQELWLEGISLHTTIDKQASLLDASLANPENLLHISHKLAALPAERIEIILEAMQPALVDGLARQDEAPIRIRLLAVSRIAEAPQFQPSAYPIYDLAFLADYVLFALSQPKKKSMRRHAIENAMRELIQSPPSMAQLEAPGSALAKLRQGLREMLSAVPEATREVLTALELLQTQIKLALSPQKPPLAITAAQLRALGALRERRSAPDLQTLLQRLSPEEQPLRGAIQHALDQMAKPPFPENHEKLAVSMALEALILLPIK